MACMQDKSKRGGLKSGDAGALPECEVKTPNHTVSHGMHAGQIKEGWSQVRRCRSTSRV